MTNVALIQSYRLFLKTKLIYFNLFYDHLTLTFEDNLIISIVPKEVNLRENTFFHNITIYSKTWKFIYILICKSYKQFIVTLVLSTASRGPFYQHGFTQMPAWMSSYIYYDV